MSIDAATFTNILVNAQHYDPAIQKPAEQQLLELEKTDVVQYLAGLCTQIATESAPLNARLLAIIRVKNAVSSHSATVQHNLTQRWLALDPALRGEIRKLLLSTMATENQQIRNIASAAVAAIATIEIPNGEWLDLIDILVNAVMDASVASFLKEASLSVIGDVCQAVTSESIGAKADKILTAIAHAMNGNDDMIKLAATRALTSCLKFCARNFETTEERNLIMNMAISVLSATNDDVKEAGWECLGEIADLYYSLIAAYLGPIFESSLVAISTHAPKVGMMAIEFWTVIAKREAAIKEDIAICEEEGSTPAEALLNYSSNAMPRLVPALLEALTKQDEDADDDSWNITSAAGLCLTVLSEVVGKLIFSLVIPVVTSSIEHANWRYRDAAMTAFGCILAAPDVNEIRDTVIGSVNVLLKLLRDPQPHVRDSAAWCFAQICENIPSVFADNALLLSFMEASLVCIRDRVRCANNMCKAIYNLAEAIQVDEQSGTSVLSPYFEGLVKALLEVTEKTDDVTLLVNGYEAVSQLIKCSAPDVHHHVISLLPLLGNRLAATVTTAMGSGEHKGYAQALLCGSLETIVNILQPEEVTSDIANSLVDIFVKVLSTETGVNEEALLGICAVARQLENNFAPYMATAFKPVMKCVVDKESTHVCRTAVTTLSGIISGLGAAVAPYCDEIVETLLVLIKSADVDRTVKPLAIEAIGDIAVAIDANFSRYLQFVMDVLGSAAVMSLTTAHPNADIDTIDYLLALQAAILTTYDSIIVSMASANAGPALKNYMTGMLDFLAALTTDPEVDAENIKKALNLAIDVIDFAKEIDPAFPAFLKTHAFTNLINQSRSHRKPVIKKAANKAALALQKL